MNYYAEIRNKIINNEIYCRVKDYSKEKHKVITYFEIGKLLNDAGGKYGNNIIEEYSKQLTIEFGTKYNYRTLYRMRKLYQVFSNEKLTPLVSKLTWSHYLQLLSIKDANKIIYYIDQTLNRNLSKRELCNIIKNNEYERLSLQTKNKLINKDKLEVKDLIPNPILIKNKNNINVINEKILHQLILEDISSFMKELGRDYSFIDSEYKIKTGDKYNYIDLLLFNIEFNCYVVVELKLTELKKEHIGQVEVYMNYINNNLKKINQDKTIGIIICKRDNKFILEYCSDDRIFAREYELI